MAEPLWWPPLLTAWVDRVEARWRSSGVDPQTRTRLRRDLVTDLGHAVLAGAAANELVEVDAEHFADDVLLAEGIEAASVALPTRTQVLLGRWHLVVVALAGAFVGGLLSLLTIVRVGARLADRDGLTYAWQGDVMLIAYAAAGLIAATCGGLAARWLFRDYPRPRLLATAVAVALVASGLVAAVLTVAFASVTGYSDRTGVVATELILVVLICAAGVGVLSWLLPFEQVPRRTGHRTS